MLGSIIEAIVNFVGSAGYLGIFFMMFLESSFIPFPSEVVMIPAGYLVYRGEMNMALIILCGIAGSIAGALLNYFIALKFGRAFIIKYGKYFFFTEAQMLKVEKFFEKHGEVSTFVGRLIAVVRQYISFPAGLARMELGRFIFFTAFGAGIWVMLLALFGFSIGQIFGSHFEISHIIHAFTASELTQSEIIIKESAKKLGLLVLLGAGLIIVAYIIYLLIKNKKT